MSQFLSEGWLLTSYKKQNHNVMLIFGRHHSLEWLSTLALPCYYEIQVVKSSNIKRRKVAINQQVIISAAFFKMVHPTFLPVLSTRISIRPTVACPWWLCELLYVSTCKKFFSVLNESVPWSWTIHLTRRGAWVRIQVVQLHHSSWKSKAKRANCWRVLVPWNNAQGENKLRSSYMPST